MTDNLPDCELTRHLQDAQKLADWRTISALSMSELNGHLTAALGLLAPAWIARNNTGKGMLVVPLAQEHNPRDPKANPIGAAKNASFAEKPPCNCVYPDKCFCSQVAEEPLNVCLRNGKHISECEESERCAHCDGSKA